MMASFCPKVLHFDRGNSADEDVDLVSSPDEDESFDGVVVCDDSFDEEIDHPGK